MLLLFLKEVFCSSYCNFFSRDVLCFFLSSMFNWMLLFSLVLIHNHVSFGVGGRSDLGNGQATYVPAFCHRTSLLLSFALQDQYCNDAWRIKTLADSYRYSLGWLYPHWGNTRDICVQATENVFGIEIVIQESLFVLLFSLEAVPEPAYTAPPNPVPSPAPTADEPTPAPGMRGSVCDSFIVVFCC